MTGTENLAIFHADLADSADTNNPSILRNLRAYTLYIFSTQISQIPQKQIQSAYPVPSVRAKTPSIFHADLADSADTKNPRILRAYTLYVFSSQISQIPQKQTIPVFCVIYVPKYYIFFPRRSRRLRRYKKIGTEDIFRGFMVSLYVKGKENGHAQAYSPTGAMVLK